MAPIKPYRCPHANCKTGFKSSASRTRHRKEQHGNGQGQIQCRKCERIFYRVYNASEHEKRVHNSPRIRPVALLTTDTIAEVSMASGDSYSTYSTPSQPPEPLQLPSVEALLRECRDSSSLQSRDYPVHQVYGQSIRPMVENRTPPSIATDYHDQHSTASGDVNPATVNPATNLDSSGKLPVGSQILSTYDDPRGGDFSPNITGMSYDTSVPHRQRK